MKPLILIFLILSMPTFAQKSEVFRIDSLPTEGVLLNKNWKFHAGDNPDFAKVDFDDSAWEDIDPTQDIFDLPQISKNGQIGWFRLTLLMDESLLKKQISLVIQQTGASEIYLNGSKIATNGIINTAEIMAKDPLWKPFPINLNNQKQQVLAVRFALQPNILYTAIFENYNPAIWINIMDSAVGVEFHYSVTSRNLIFIFLIIGISFMIFVIHFSFYLLYPNQKANLYFSLFSLFFLLGSLSQYFYWLQPFQVSYKFYLGNLAFLLFIIAYINLLTAAYLFLEKKKDFIYYFLAVFAIIAVVLNAYPYNIGWKFGGPMLELFVQINIARIAVIAVRKKQKGSWIIAIGAFSTLIFFVIFLSQGTFTNASFLLSLPLKRMIFYNFFVLSLPISTSLFLAFQFSKINEDIQWQLIENQNLADEKQQILSTQNETLETQVIERTAELKHKNRDLEIEASLEKVRARALEMQKSDEIMDVAVTLYDEMQNLDFKYGLSSIMFIDRETIDLETWIAGFNYNKYPESYHIGYFEHPFMKATLSAWRKGEKFLVYDFTLEEKKSWDEHLFSKTTYKNVPAEIQKQMRETVNLTMSMAFTKHGSINWAPTPLSEEKAAILQRFAFVFEQAYTRFLDLKKAEEQAREAQIEVALERVRSRAMAMQNSNELSELVTTLFDELIKLDLVLARCIIWIFDAPTLSARIWMANSEDSKTADSYYIKKLAHPYYEAILRGWKEKQAKWVYELQGEEKKSIDNLLLTETELAQLPTTVKMGILSSEHTIVSGSSNNFGLIEASGPSKYSEEQLEILSRFGKVFDLTYTRFNDLKIAEHHAQQAELDLVKLQTEKKRAEDALSLLKSTQTQLIQKEKLASLGELTAGIAHEIQNPLNFVNNFSELSVDLVKDLKEEIEKPEIDKEYVGELFTDLSQNQEKINHHGKRASSIVKGMLEHSRASTGIKELTDINALADEYFRLSYHGMRAKDKEFNATMETHFQDPLSKIEIIPQDIGRVLLNLINNAFYAVSEKNKQNTERVSYNPTVTITTQQIDNQIIIKVKDNGMGMSEAIKDKVFQPFFTTKPTGQGTGLGLSLAYDIVVKGHGGSLEVESAEGVGTEFTIQLIINQ